MATSNVATLACSGFLLVATFRGALELTLDRLS
jgi:hypothetical protein